MTYDSDVYEVSEEEYDAWSRVLPSTTAKLMDSHMLVVRDEHGVRSSGLFDRVLLEVTR